MTASTDWMMSHSEDGIYGVQVWPLNDIFDHDLDSVDCTCGPKVEFADPETGLTYANGPFVSHYSLDGRDTEDA